MVLKATLRPDIDFRRRAAELTERMDDPDCDLTKLHRTYAQFAAVNALVSGWWGVYTGQIRPYLRRDQAATLLDIGSGGGDVPRRLAYWAAHDGFRLQVTAIDADARAVAYASSLGTAANLQFRQAFSGDLVQEGQTFDFITSNHLLHHLTAPELTALLEDSERLCRVAVIHSDLERSALAYAAFGVGIGPWFRGSFIREDGMLSIRRSYTAPELAQVAPAGWRVQRQWPYRTLLTYQAPHA
ncbi:class I SAM-dependent methyltransferase [Deinococcus sp. QL22]|uniref:class I SAM-dependent methyltransferase n=1 Tax=Deinococcus sp. QL22 TaxID=2939437 RepID=UPI002017C2C4|nr:class I SAM-dependent methyltransferase [Deinococcus sp. QL22]UQN09549.1 class I SAM-dependent methyltransferase [Deinococcus sp. QL22]